MEPGRHSRPLLNLALAFAGLAPAAGCAGQSSLLASRTTVGSLRTSVSHLQYENEELKRQVADLKADGRKLEDQLVQEETRNGDLTARLDDARQALRTHGSDGAASSLEPEPIEPPQRARPAGRSNKSKRKPPFAQIPGWGADSPSEDDEGTSEEGSRAGGSGPHTWRDKGDGWFPVARRPMSAISQIR